MFSFLKLFVSVVSVGAVASVPVTLALKDQVSTPAEEIQEKEEKLEQEDIVDSQEPEGSRYSVTLPEDQAIEGEKEEVKLCKELVRSNEHLGRLMVCRTDKDDSQVKFNYITDLVVDTVPHEIISIKFTYDSLIAELKEQLDYSKTRLFNLTWEISSGRGLIQLDKVVEKFNTKDCKVEWIDGEQKDWRVRCEVN